MSSQSMKYHELPSFETLVAFQKGDLSAVESRWIEQLIQNNPMVRAVAESASSINSTAVKSLSKRTSVAISTTYYSKAGFWTKYGVWIGLSAIALLIGFTYLFQTLQVDAIYQQTALSSSISDDNSTMNQSPKKQAAILVSDVKSEEERIHLVGYDESEDILNVNQTLPSDESNNFNNKEEDFKNLKSAKPLKEPKDKSNSTSSDLALGQPKDKTQDNTRIFTSDVSTSSKMMILAVQNVQILAKTNPDDFSSSSKKDKKGNPMQTFGQKPTSNSSYSIDDIPKYPGGDRALQNYFAGKLHPLKIKEKENHYDKTVMVDLEINYRGRLKDYTIHGELHPDHQQALIKAIEEMPRFNKGTESITYSLGISF